MQTAVRQKDNSNEVKDEISKDFNWHYAQLLALIKQYRANYHGNISLYDDDLLEHACATVPYWCNNHFEMVELSLNNQIIQYQEIKNK